MLYCRLQTHIFKLFPVSSSHILSSLCPKYFKFWLVTQQDTFPLFSTPILVPLGKFESLSLISSPKMWFFDCNPFRPFLMSSAARSKFVFLLFLRDVIFRYVSSFLVSFRGLPLHFLSSTFPVFFCFFRIAWTPHLETSVWRAISSWEYPYSCNITTQCLVTIDFFVILDTVNIWFRRLNCRKTHLRMWEVCINLKSRMFAGFPKSNFLFTYQIEWMVRRCPLLVGT